MPEENKRAPKEGGERPAGRRPSGKSFNKTPGDKRFGGNRNDKFGKTGNQGGNRPPFRGKDGAPGQRRERRADSAPEGERRAPEEKAWQKSEHRPNGGDHARRSENNNRFGGNRGKFSDKKPAFGGNDRRPRGDAPRRDGAPTPVRRAPKPEAKPVPKIAPSDGMASRRLAYEVLTLVINHGAYASLALDEKLRESTIPAVDRRLAARLVYDTLDSLSYLDFALSHVMARPDDSDQKLMNVLRLAACQILLEDRIPESAATNTAVQLCKEIGLEGLAGVCNGILRNLLRDVENIPWPDRKEEPVRYLSVLNSVPEWLVERYIEDWGEENAAAMLGVRAHNKAVTIRRNLLRGSDEQFEATLAKKVWTVEKGEIPHTWNVKNALNLGEDNDFKNGEFSIQSEGSILACCALNPKRGWTVLDACAAPGGKSCLMAEMMGGTGRVQAWELHPHRTELIEAQKKRLHLENVRPMNLDAAKPRENLNQTMDAVLLDAPCTGTGDLADKPDIKLRLKEENVAELVKTQAELLDTVSAYVKEGGVLVYSTCSVLREENGRQVEAFLQRHPEFEISPLPDTVPEKWRTRADETGLQLLPHVDGAGFYLCRMKRRFSV